MERSMEESRGTNVKSSKQRGNFQRNDLLHLRFQIAQVLFVYIEGFAMRNTVSFALLVETLRGVPLIFG